MASRSKSGPSLVAALDVGTAKMCCLIARLNARGQLHTVACETRASVGLHNAAIVDIDAVSSTVASVVEAAERQAKASVSQVLVSISGGRPHTEWISAEIPLSDRAIGSAEVRRALAVGRERLPANGRAQLHYVPLGYSVDGVRGVRDPRGLYGETLGLESVVITIQRSKLRTLQTALSHAHLAVDQMVASAYAAGLGVLHADERELGVTVIDMGAGSTDIAVFYEGEPVFCDSIPLGGAHVTYDIAHGLTTPIATAERLKVLNGTCLPSASDESDMLTIVPAGEDSDATSHEVPRSLLVRIVQARMEEIFELASQCITASDAARFAGSSVVLTGGTAQLNGVLELAGRLLDKRARIGRPTGIVGMADRLENPAFAAVVGMLNYAQKRSQGTLALSAFEGSGTDGMPGRLISWLGFGR